MTTMLKEFSNMTAAQAGFQTSLKSVDGTDAGKNDVSNKSDVKFDMMRNMINTGSTPTGSSVNDYLEKAHDLNDEVDTVAFGLETGDNDIIKVYVNAEQADAFEAEMSKLLGLEDDVESAINQLAQKFDIVDVVWPQDPEADAEDSLTIDNAFDKLGGESEEDIDLPDEDDSLPADTGIQDETDELSSDSPDDETAEPDDEMKEPEAAEDESAEDESDESESDEDESAEDESAEDESAEDESAEDESGEVKKKKKKEIKQEDLNYQHEQGVQMSSLGQKFLTRVIAEDEDRDGIRDGLNIPLDSQYRTLVAQLKRQIDRKLVGFYAMSGVPGRYVANYDGIIDRIEAIGNMFRAEPIKRRVFDEFYSALAAMRGFTPVAAKVQEAKKKRGSFLQKQFETILIHLGMPEELMTTSGPGSVGGLIYHVVEQIESNPTVKNAMMKLAIRLGINSVETDADLTESVDVGTDEFFQKVVALAEALGIPERNLQFQRPNLIKSLRMKKMALGNRGMIESRIDALMLLIAKADRSAPQQAAQPMSGIQPRVQEQLDEEFSELRALSHADLKKYKLEEPYGGPAMIANHVGEAKHSETTLLLGVDASAKGRETLCVKVESPYDGEMTKRYFENTDEGYKRAMNYAEKHRTHTPESGGRYKGWKDE